MKEWTRTSSACPLYEQDGCLQTNATKRAKICSPAEICEAAPRSRYADRAHAVEDQIDAAQPNSERHSLESGLRRELLGLNKNLYSLHR